MKTVLDELTRDELIKRINSLSDNSKAQWGKMTVSQMIRHCSQWDEMALGKKKYKQSFIGKLFGKTALKSMLKDEPLKKNLPTVPSFKITGNSNVAEEKNKWVQSLREYQHLSNDGIVHPFFGAMTKEQIAFVVYKHADHHLRQFNA
jgi:hypothetical protein